MATDDSAMRLSITYLGDCWTEITDAGGRRLFFDLGKEGRTVNLTGEAPFNVLFGDAANVSIEVNGGAFEIFRCGPPRADSQTDDYGFMTTKPRAIRGMNDILPEDSATWRYLESVVQEIVHSYGYSEIRLPLLEYTELFKRSIGEVTDIVEKEMYTFPDRNGESLTLRPEATASMVRAGMTNGLFHNQKQKLWTSGTDVPLRKTAAGPLSAVLPV